MTVQPMDRTRSSAANLKESAVDQLRAQVRGALIAPGDPDYDSARKVYNGMIDRHPRLILHARDVADVIAGVNFAREQGLDLAVRSGGHNGPGLGTVDDGLVIDLAPMNGVRVDPRNKSVRVEGGATWGDVDHATHAFGMATPSGIISTTGVGGLTLGGGMGHLTRKAGLTIDNLLEADVVLADGRLVRAAPDENPDLFWALRGGGGNFGVVTSFLFRLHPIDTVIAGPTLYPMEKAPEVMRWWSDFIKTAPNEIGGWFAFLVVPPGPPFPEELHLKPMCGIVWCYTGPHDKADEALAPIREFGPPAFTFVVPMPQPTLQSMFDGLYPPGLQWYWKADFVKELSDEAIALHAEHGARIPTMHSTMHLYCVNGAAHNVAPGETAWGHRDANWSMVVVGVDPDASNKDKITSWAREYWAALHPHSAGGAYVNMMMEEGQERIEASYGENYAQLARIKAKYDPNNLFHVNQNIKPQR